MADQLDRLAAEGLFGGEDDADQYVVVALDPGGTTGWCVIGVHPDAMSGDPQVKILDNVEFWTAGQFVGNEDDQCDEVVELIEAWPSARLVTELFTLRSRVTSPEIFALERMNAILRWAIRPRYMVFQQPSLAMTTITDERQKEMGFWIPGQEHARDATKHALTFLKRQRDRQIKAAAGAAREAAR
jgi:hypothetical protein